MLARIFVSVAVVFLWFSACANPVQAGGAIWCTISVDGQEAFSGWQYRSPNEEAHELVRYIGHASMRPVRESTYNSVPKQDIDLSGDIEFEVHEFPTMQMQSIRLVYSPSFTKSGNIERVESKWSIHPEDVKNINAFYGAIADKIQARIDFSKRIEQWWIYGFTYVVPVALIGLAIFLCWALLTSPRLDVNLQAQVQDRSVNEGCSNPQSINMK